MDHQSERKSASFRSTISSNLLKLALKRGAFLGGTGALFLLICPMAKALTLPLFLLGLFLIAKGWLPHRQLSKLQLKPHELHLDSEHLFFIKQGKPLFKIPVASLEKITYIEKKDLYGLGISLKNPAPHPISVLQPHFNCAEFMQDSQKRFQCDLFLPYFTESTVRKLT